MLNDIVSGIVKKLNDTFGDGYEIYTEQVKQGLKEPCFIVTCVNSTRIPVTGTRYLYTNMFSVTYFPKSKTTANEELYAVQQELLVLLEYIEGDILFRRRNSSFRL